MNDLDAVFNRLSSPSTKRAVADVETDGLSRWTNKICGWVWTFSGDPKDSFYLPVRHASGQNLDPKKTATMVKTAAKKNPGLRILGHNLSFDLGFMEAEGIDNELFDSFEDSQINASLIDEHQGKFSLDACCRFMGVQEKKGAPLYEYLAKQFGGPVHQNQMGNYWKLSAQDPMGVDYAKGDGTSTWQLIEEQGKRIDEQELRRIWDIEARCIRVVHRMSMRGIRVDEQRMAYVRKLVQDRYDQFKSKFPKDFNERGASDMEKLMRDAGHTDWPKTPKKGQPSFTEAWLKTTPIGRDVIGLRKLSHLLNAFFNPLEKEHIHAGRVHCHYNQTRGEFFGTVTGRLSCDSPNMQQIHKRDKVLGSIFRSIFIPDEGYEWGDPDYVQCEPRLLAHYAECQVLLKGFLADPPVDAHQAVATAAHIDRESGKRLNQALLTGAGIEKTIEMVGGDPDETRKMVAAYHRAMPEIKALQKLSARVMLGRGYVKSLLGRRARLERPGFEYKAINRLLQCGNADVLKLSMVNVDEGLRARKSKTNMLNNVHDALSFQYPIGQRKDYNWALGVMQDYGPGRSVELSVPLTVDAKEGRNWAEATYGVETVKKGFEAMGGKYV